MSRIRGKDTRPELLLRRALHACGLCYRLNDRTLPGRPDLVFPSKRAARQQHDCERFKWPKTRRNFWSEKLQLNGRRYARAIADLHRLGWRTLAVWECTLTGARRITIDKLAELATAFVRGNRDVVQINAEKPLRLRRMSAR
jgi:DNA mismatch endonuclease (patch repair protein)